MEDDHASISFIQKFMNTLSFLIYSTNQKFECYCSFTGFIFYYFYFFHFDYFPHCKAITIIK